MQVTDVTHFYTILTFTYDIFLGQSHLNRLQHEMIVLKMENRFAVYFSVVCNSSCMILANYNRIDIKATIEQLVFLVTYVAVYVAIMDEKALL